MLFFVAHFFFLARLALGASLVGRPSRYLHNRALLFRPSVNGGPLGTVSMTSPHMSSILIGVASPLRDDLRVSRVNLVSKWGREQPWNLPTCSTLDNNRTTLWSMCNGRIHECIRHKKLANNVELTKRFAQTPHSMNHEGTATPTAPFAAITTKTWKM